MPRLPQPGTVERLPAERRVRHHRGTEHCSVNPLARGAINHGDRVERGHRAKTSFLRPICSAPGRNYGADPRCSAMNSRQGRSSVIRKCLRRATQPTNTCPPTSGGVGTETCASGPNASGVAAKRTSSGCFKSNANVACTRLLGQARRSSNRSRVPRRARIRACRPIRREWPDRHCSSRQYTVVIVVTKLCQRPCPARGAATARAKQR
jgi:hypothetical protein